VSLRLYVECHYAECRYAKCPYAECRHTECLYAECRCAECRGALVNIALALHKSILCITAFHLKARIYLSDLIVQFWQFKIGIFLL
jgi:hypothetical protein